MNEEDKKLFKELQKSPIYFIEKCWGLVPQPLKEPYKAIDWELKDYKADWFEPFILGEHISWQQWLLLKAVENAVHGSGKKRISVKSGHGTGKSTGLSWIVLWYLFVFKNAQIPCTAPTADQLHDVLWKEMVIWLNRMPPKIKAKYSVTSDYIRILESPETWFARARTGKKENPEALAGVHGDWVMYIIDEASGIPIEIFKTAEGALTGKNVLVIMISNATRLQGYFYDSHHTDSYAWQNLRFNSEESPLVEKGFIERIAKKHGADSDEYRIRVLGEFPREDAIDDAGYVPLLVKDDIKKIGDAEFSGVKIMGIDPAGEGTDETIWVIRDNFKARVVGREKISNPKSIAQKTITLMEYYDVKDYNIFVDNFGVGANVAVELGLSALRIAVNSVNVGDKASDDDVYANKRAEIYFRGKKWIRKGGEFIGGDDWDELLNIKYKRNMRGKIQLKSKDEMRKDGIPSPDRSDAWSLTFWHEEAYVYKEEYEPRQAFDKFAVVNPI